MRKLVSDNNSFNFLFPTAKGFVDCKQSVFLPSQVRANSQTKGRRHTNESKSLDIQNLYRGRSSVIPGGLCTQRTSLSCYELIENFRFKWSKKKKITMLCTLNL